MRQKLVTGAALLTLGLLAACGGGSSDDGDDGAAAPTTAASVSPVAGCEQATADLTITPSKKPARCSPGAPAAVPLPAKTTVKVAVSSKGAEFISPYALGLLKGEFAKENLDVQTQVLPPADGLQLLASGGIDAVVGSSTAAVFNAIGQDFDVRWAIGQGWNNPTSKAGLWVKGEGATFDDLKGKTIGSAVGVGSPVNVPIVQGLPAGVTITDLKFETSDVTEVATALQNGAVQAGILLDPYWLPLVGKPGYTFLAPTIPPGGNLGGVYYGPSLAKTPQVEAAFARAYIRTVNTYLDGDYKADPATLADLAKALDTPVDKLKQTPSFIWDYDIPHGESDQLQKLFLDAKVATYKSALPEGDIVDRTSVAAAVGIPRD
jgi:NitT/TauT family transport system substrate-binding protein